MIKAVLKNYRQSPRKVRLVADSIRGRKVDTALTKLDFTTKRSALPIKKLINSAVANAKNNYGLDSDDLFIKSIMVDEGYTLKRWRPRARGSAFPINKRTSHVTVILEGKEGVKTKKVSKKKSSKKSTSSKVKKTKDTQLPKAPKKEGHGREGVKKVQAARTTNK